MNKQRTHAIEENVKRLLKPVVRFCLRYSLKIQEIIPLLKEVLLEVSREELRAEGTECNVSKLSIITGLQRREIKLIQDSPNGNEPVSNLLSKIIGTWQFGKDYYRKVGTGRPLTFEGTSSEFSRLVRSISQDLNPYTVLGELERTGRVERKNGKLHLNAEVYEVVGPEKITEAVHLVAADWDDLIAAAHSNVLQEEELPHLHLRTEFDNIDPESFPQIRAWLLDKGTTLHEEPRRYLSQFDRDANSSLQRKKCGGKVSLGSFSFTQTVKTLDEK